MFDLQKFLNRMNWSQADFSRISGIHRSKVGGWAAGYREPDYQNLCTLLKMGMTLEEAFGPEIAEVVLHNQPSIDINSFSEEDCRKIVSIALSSLGNSADKGLKK